MLYLIEINTLEIGLLNEFLDINLYKMDHYIDNLVHLNLYIRP